MPGVSVHEAEILFRDDLDAMRREYTRMRDIAHKRMQRMSRTEFRNTETYQKWGTDIPKLKDMDLRDLPKLYSELSRFVNSRLSTITGQRRAQAQTMKTLNAAIGAGSGEGVTRANYWRVITILNEARKQKVAYGSDKMVELANTTMALNPDQFDALMDKLSKALEQPDTIMTKLDNYMTHKEIQGYQRVDMADAMKSFGW